MVALRGIGSMVAMFGVGRLVGCVDVRYPILFGFIMMAAAVYQMAGFTADVSIRTIIITGLLQGADLGVIFVFVFAPLAPSPSPRSIRKARNNGDAMFSPMRNIGSGIGISGMITMLVQNT